MPRLQRFVAEESHHAAGQSTPVGFDDHEDRRVYLRLLQEYCTKHEIRILAWCLTTNHVHLLAVPPSAPALAKAMGGTHGDYARYRNVRMAVTGHLWQARYYSCPVDSPGGWQVMAYIERNPVRAGLVDVAEAYRWSSAPAHVAGASDPILDTELWRQNYNPQRWREVLRMGLDEEAMQERLRLATRTGRPFGSNEFGNVLEWSAERPLLRRPGGRRKASEPVPGLEGQVQLEIG